MYHIYISRAKPNYTDDYIDWHLPIAQGNAMIHAYHVANGEAMIWPQIERSELGRSFSRLAARIAAKRKELGLGKANGDGEHKASANTTTDL